MKLPAGVYGIRASDRGVASVYDEASSIVVARSRFRANDYIAACIEDGEL